VVRSGIVHVHSTFSYDGEHTLAELASFGRKCGYSFIGMTEHSDTFDHAKMKALVEECRHLSDGEFLLMAGIEFSCEGDLHLMGLGIKQFTSVRDPIGLARFIRGQGGLAVVSHPSRYGYEIPPALVDEVDGIEVWNASNDSRFAPDWRVLNLWRELRRHNHTLTAFGGQDLHRITRQRHVKLVLNGQDGELTAERVLACLRRGKFIVSNRYLRIGGDRPPGWARLSVLAWMWRGLMAAKSLRDRVSRRTAVSG
jgi:predicted metal-dependent phosphoesterase TrpH